MCACARAGRAIEPKQGLVVTVDMDGQIYLDQAGLSMRISGPRFRPLCERNGHGGDCGPMVEAPTPWCRCWPDSRGRRAQDVDS